MKLKKGSIALLTLAGMFYMSVQKADACTRAVYIGPDHMVVTGRTMDWKEDIMSNIYVFPRGIQRAGYNKENAVKWTSKYGSVIATGYDIGTCDGMNEKGLVASLLFLPESVFDRPRSTLFPYTTLCRSREIHVLSWGSAYGHNMYWTILPPYMKLSRS